MWAPGVSRTIHSGKAEPQPPPQGTHGGTPHSGSPAAKLSSRTEEAADTPPRPGTGTSSWDDGRRPAGPAIPAWGLKSQLEDFSLGKL